MSSDDMMALMNNPSLLMGGSVKGSTMSGNNRDADGTVDRVGAMPEELRPLMKKMKRVIDLERIDMSHLLKEQGATPYGTMNKQRFNSILTIIFSKAIIFSLEDLKALDTAYGTGAKDLHDKGTMEYIAWMDFCEDMAEIDASYWAADDPRVLALMNDLDDDGKVDAPKAMSANAMMLDMLDGVEGTFDETKMWEHRSLMGDKRWS